MKEGKGRGGATENEFYETQQCSIGGADWDLFKEH